MEGEFIPKKRRSDSRYKDEYCDLIIEILARGDFISHFCSQVGISESTYYDWQKDNEEFAEACLRAKVEGKAFYETCAKQMVLGKLDSKGMGALALILNNKHREDYSRSPNGSGDTNINYIGNINNVSNLDEEQLKTKIETLQKKLGIIKSE